MRTLTKKKTMKKRQYNRGQNRQHYVELRTQNNGFDYTESITIKGKESKEFGNLTNGESVLIPTIKGGKITRKAINIDECSTRSNKANKIVRTQQSIDNKINGISRCVEMSTMTNKQKRKHYALNK